MLRFIMMGGVATHYPPGSCATHRLKIWTSRGVPLYGGTWAPQFIEAGGAAASLNPDSAVDTVVGVCPSSADPARPDRPQSHFPHLHPNPMQVTVKLFAAYQEAYGQPELNWDLPEGAPVTLVLERVLAEHPELEQWRSVTRFGVNLQFVSPDTPLTAGDEVVLIPPVSGG
ncbi:MAG: MoaD/ThiS family protein [Prochlorothrix sp.]|nr:MoaD/ThiS family protein [Prochlorothrix sp.]